MFLVGFIDDSCENVEAYQMIFKSNEIVLLFVENCKTQQDVVGWIIKNAVKCMLIDYKLTNKYSFNGTELFAFVNSKLPDLPCKILTSYSSDAKREKLVIEDQFIEKKTLENGSDSDKFKDLCTNLKQATEVFDSRLRMRLEEFEVLYKKRDEHNSIESERFIELYKLLREYGEVDEIPADLLTPKTNQQLSDILDMLNKLLNK